VAAASTSKVRMVALDSLTYLISMLFQTLLESVLNMVPGKTQNNLPFLFKIE